MPEPAGAALEPEAKRLRAEKGSLTQACDVAIVVRQSADDGGMVASAADVMAGQAASAADVEAGQAASAAVFPPTHLLPLKSESVIVRLGEANPVVQSGNEYRVLWSRRLGKGAYGKTYVGTAPAKMQVAIKVFHGVPLQTQERDVESEVRRHCALAGARNLLKLLDVACFLHASVKYNKVMNELQKTFFIA